MWNIREKALKFCKGKGLDIGCNKWPLDCAHPVDNDPGENAYVLDKWDDGSLDFVFSSHCLEHLEKWRDALALWSRKLKKGGILFLYLPHESMTLWEPGSPWVGNDHVWSPTAKVVSACLKELGMDIVEVDEGPDNFHSFHVVATKA
nr:methyltransferase domain-containing protein [Kordiimonas marina]